jgi:hypothetical protein
MEKEKTSYQDTAEESQEKVLRLKEKTSRPLKKKFDTSTLL